LLIHEAFYQEAMPESNPDHSAAGQVGEVAARAGVEALALVHRMDTTRQAIPAYRALAAKHFSGRILVPQAGDRWTL
jgi:ribonuclease BN (tRNA processing enzyme)